MSNLDLYNWLTLSERRQDLLRRYGGAMVVLVLAVAVRAALDPLLQGTGFLLFSTAMLIAAWVGGLVPCLIAQVLLLVVEGLFFRNEQAAAASTLEVVTGLLAYFGVGIVVAWLSDSRRAIRRRVFEQQEEMLNQREQLKAMFACMADGVVVTDTHGRITLVNPTAESLTGWMLHNCQGKDLAEILPIYEATGGRRVEDLVQAVLAKQTTLHEGMDRNLMTRSGDLLPIAYSAAPLFDGRGRTAGIVLLLSDQTERRRTLEELRTANKQKDEFLATLAHELRNPLAPISMGVELLKMSSDDPSTSSEVLATVERQTQHMVRLIDDLLDVSRITRGKMELRKNSVPLAEVVQNAVEATRPLMAEAEHELVIDIPSAPLLLDVDANRFAQILSNLLNNAAKYTPAGGRVEIRARTAREHLHISIADNGVGIPEHKLDAVFEMFMQDRETMENGHKGLGIGLTLVKRLTEMHGGKVEVHSGGRDQGSTFSLHLPLEAVLTPREDVAPSLATERRLPGAGRILIVDDNEDSLKTLSQFVRKLGNEVHQARNGLEAVDSAEQLRPDVILMDIGMPKLNGLEAAKRIRQQSWGKTIPLVATTGWGQAEDRQRTQQAGFDHHLVKPIDHAHLIEVLAEALPPQTELSDVADHRRDEVNEGTQRTVDHASSLRTSTLPV